MKKQICALYKMHVLYVVLQLHEVAGPQALSLHIYAYSMYTKE